MPAFAAAISEHPQAALAVGDVVGTVVEQMGSAPDVACVFVAGHSPEVCQEIATAIHELLQPTVLIGATAEAVVGGSLEAEDGPAISLWAGRVGPVEPVRLEALRAPEGTAVTGMPDDAARGGRTLILLSDPYGFPAEALTTAVNEQYPLLRLVGGVASAPGGPGANRLILHDHTYSSGAVGVLLPEGMGELVEVSQGCRPIGEPWIVTESMGNQLVGLAMRPVLERLQDLVDQAGPADRELMARGLHLGVVVEESSTEFSRGDFLVRGILGADHAAGSLRVGCQVPVGTTVQFHVRDALTATEDLERILAGVDADAALLFTGAGRGHRLFGISDHDASRVVRAVSGGPVAGMFCAGEYGPIRGANFVHGSTASMLFVYG